MTAPEVVADIIKRFISHFRVIEVALVAALFWWGFILIIPIDTFGSSSVYNSMAEIAGEEVWAFVFIVVAAANLYSLIMKRFFINVVSSIISTGLWFYIATTFAINDVATTGTGIYYILACLNIFVVYKVGEHHG